MSLGNIQKKYYFAYEYLSLSRFNQCYGVLGVLDRLHGTDDKFRNSKAYERHTVLLSLTPLSESIPNDTKKSQD